MAVPQNSTFKYTDTGVTPFVVKPYTINGPLAPASTTLYSNPDSGIAAVSANSSILFFGRGLPYYGDLVLNNMLYMLEHFANATRPVFPVIGQQWYKKADFTDPVFPSDPTTKGLYIWTGTSWDPIVMKDAKSPVLDLNNNRILNLGDAILETDAMNQRSSDTRYVRISGSDMGGVFILVNGSFYADPGASISMVDTPTLLHHVTNLEYVTFVSDTLSGMIDAVDSRIDAIALGNGEFAALAGATFTGDVLLSNTATLIAASGGPALLLGGRRVGNVGTPTAADDAATKDYVDDADALISGTIATLQTEVDGVQTDLATNYAELSGATFTGTVVVSSTGDFSLLSGGGQAGFGGRRLQSIGTPVSNSDAVTKQYVDYYVAAGGSRPTRRYVVTQVTPGIVSFTLPDSMAYTVDTNKLQVYLNGVKQYCNTHGKAFVAVTGTQLSPFADVGLGDSQLYTFNATVDGAAPVAIPVTTGVNTTFSELVTLLNIAAGVASAGVFFSLDVYSSTALYIIATSETSGALSTVVLSYGVGSLFESIPNSAAPTSSTGVPYGYQEDGPAGTSITGVEFTAAPAVDDVIEFILFP